MSDAAPTNETITVTHYEGNESPIIRIDTESLVTLRLIKTLFEDLSNNKYQEFRFEDMANVRFSGLEALTLRVIAGDREPRKALERVRADTELPSFLWSRTSEGWDDNAWWVDGILVGSGRGHQYLTNEGIDDALIVIALGEGH